MTPETTFPATHWARPLVQRLYERIFAVFHRCVREALDTRDVAIMRRRIQEALDVLNNPLSHPEVAAEFDTILKEYCARVTGGYIQASNSREFQENDWVRQQGRFAGFVGQKQEQGGSTSADKNATLKENHEGNQSPSRTGPAETRGEPQEVGRVLSKALEPTAADDGRGSPSSSRDVETRSLKDSRRLAQADQATLASLRAAHPEFSRDPDPKFPNDGGAEHVVQNIGDGLAHKYSTGFGHIIDGNGKYPPARAQEYLDRVQLINESFHAKIKVVGISEHNGTTGIATTMPWINGAGRNPSELQVGRMMAARGFEQTGYNEVFYNPSTRVLAHDAAPRNFILDQDGVVHPIDLGMQRIRSGGKIEVWIKAGGGFE